MIRRWLTVLPLALALAGSVVVPGSASAAIPVCLATTPAMHDLAASAQDLTGALRDRAPAPGTVATRAKDFYTKILAAQSAGCLPQLTELPPGIHPLTSVQTGSAACTVDTIDLLVATLDLLKAGIAVPPKPVDIVLSVPRLATAITGVNRDSCLPAKLAVPQMRLLPPFPPRR